MKNLRLSFLVVSLCALFFAQSVYAEKMPEFGDSITFAKGSPKPNLTMLKGKVVCIIFFQSYCPKCNVKAPILFKQMEALLKDDGKVALIAIKTDGGDANSALQFLKTHGAHPKYWSIGSDKNAKFYKRVYGKKIILWGTVMVNEDGNISKRFWALHYLGTDKTRFMLGNSKVFAPYRKAKAFVPENLELPKKFEKGVHYLESGDFPVAKKYIDRCSGGSKDAAKILIGVMEKKIDKIFNSAIDTMRDANLSNADRYFAVCEVETLVPLYRSYPSAKKALLVARKVGATEAILKEKKAEIEYNKLLARLNRTKTKASLKRLQKRFVEVAKLYPGTEFGKRAKKIADRKI